EPGIPGERGQSGSGIGAGAGAQPGVAFEDGQRPVRPPVELDRGVGKREALPGAGEPRKPERSGKGGTLRVDGQTPVEAGVLRLAPGERKARRNCRQLARKSPAQVAAAGDLHADRSVIAFE